MIIGVVIVILLASALKTVSEGYVVVLGIGFLLLGIIAAGIIAAFEGGGE